MFDGYIILGNDKGGKMIKLKEIAEIQTGLVLSRKEAAESSNEFEVYRQLNLKAINSEGYIDMELLEEFKANEVLSKDYITRKDDILVRLTSPYTAVLIDENSAGIVVPSHFIIVRARKEYVLPEYLYWLLNSDRVKLEIAKNISSTTTGAVKPAVYASLVIDELSLEQQKNIATVYSLTKKEAYLYEQLKSEKERYYKETIKNIYENYKQKRSR